MQQSYSIVKPEIIYTNEPINLKQVADSVTPVYPNNSGTGQKNYPRSGGAKNDSLVLHDFFGALNY